MQETKESSLPQNQLSQVLQKKLSQEAKLKLWQNAKKRSQRSCSYSKTHRSFQDMLRVYDSPKQQIKAISCKKDFRSSSVEPESLNFSFYSESDKIKTNVSDTKVSDDFLLSPQTNKSKSLSAILDEENEKSNESDASPYFGFARSSKPKKKREFEEAKEPKEDQQHQISSFHQLKKVLTEENQLQNANLSAFSFQKDLPQTNCTENKEEIKNDLLINFQEYVKEKDSKIEETVLESSKKLKIEKKSQTSLKKQKTNEIDQAELKESTYVYSYSLKKPNKKLIEDYGVEQVITPVKSSSRKQSLHSNLITSIAELTNVSNILYIPNEKIEDNCPPANSQCVQLKDYLKSNAKLQNPKLLKESSTKKEKIIDGIEEFTRVIDPNFNNHGNYALLEISAERAKKFKIGTRKVLTPLKLVSEEEILENLTRKEDINMAVKEMKDYGYIPYDEKIPSLIEKITKNGELTQ